jgi:hypothetical protein
MGYILPVQPFQYNDYQNRIIKTKQDTKFIDKPFKVILDRHHQEIVNEYDRINKTMYASMGTKQTNECMFTALTGKGGHFNKSV